MMLDVKSVVPTVVMMVDAMVASTVVLLVERTA